jgi:hypothetical protein
LPGARGGGEYLLDCLRHEQRGGLHRFIHGFHANEVPSDDVLSCRELGRGEAVRLMYGPPAAGEEVDQTAGGEPDPPATIDEDRREDEDECRLDSEDADERAARDADSATSVASLDESPRGLEIATAIDAVLSAYAVLVKTADDGDSGNGCFCTSCRLPLFKAIARLRTWRRDPGGPRQVDAPTRPEPGLGPTISTVRSWIDSEGLYYVDPSFLKGVLCMLLAEINRLRCASLPLDGGG